MITVSLPRSVPRLFTWLALMFVVIPAFPDTFNVTSSQCTGTGSLLEAVEAATANGPLTLGPQAPMSGQLQAGYDADVIAFDGDPLADLDIWGDASRVTHVWKGGELVKSPA